MGDLMRPISFLETLKRIVGEYQADKTIFGIPAKEFYRRNHNKLVKVFTETCETAVGPAAGPHTQLTQNIIAYLLKTDIAHALQFIFIKINDLIFAFDKARQLFHLSHTQITTNGTQTATITTTLTITTITTMATDV